MPLSHRTLTLETARDLIRERSFRATTGGSVGVELEFFTGPSADPRPVTALEAMLRPVTPLPFGSRISFEPGAQVEVSSPPFPGIDEACDAVATDARVMRERLAACGVGTFAGGYDPARALELRNDGPRYVAMRRFFDQFGVWGGRMMCGTAAIHVNIDGGSDGEGRARWRTAHRIAPTMLAAFANSPIVDGRPAGWKSSRFAAWERIDPTRTSPVRADGDPASAWADYALAARAMLVRREDRFEPILDLLTFADWIEDGYGGTFPDAEDLAYHLTTLFPPVRPHGHLEIRVLDMLPDPWWRVAVAVTCLLVMDPAARERADAACEGVADAWSLAARCGLGDPSLHAAAVGCFDAAIDASKRLNLRPDTRGDIAAFAQRFVRAGRCPADDLLDTLQPISTTEAS